MPNVMKFDGMGTCRQYGEMYTSRASTETRSSADADNGLDAFSGQSRSTNIVPFHMLHIECDIEMGVKGHSRSLRVVSFDRLCMVSY